MILSDIGIKDALEKGILEISPKPSEDQYTTSAVDLYLGSEFKCWDWERLSTTGTKTILNLAEHSFRTTAGSFLLDYPAEKDGSYILPPYSGKSVPVLAMTRERVYLKPESSCAARVEGRSSLARLGLVVHLTAPIIHAGFNAPITLEMVNYGPFHLQLNPGKTRICQLVIEKLETPPIGDIRTEFQHQTSPAGKK